jgi:L-fucose isomerase
LRGRQHHPRLKRDSMAQRTADFLRADLYHRDGLPVECIFADICIGGVAEADQTAEKFRCEGAGLINSLMR